MRSPRYGVLILALICAFSLFAGTPARAADADRKLILVLDASRSLSGYTDRATGLPVPGTDPDGLRFDAIEEFLDYLRRDAERGSKETYEVGYVIFSNDIDESEEPRPLSGSGSALTRQSLEAASAQAKGQYTNTGAALWEAVRLTNKGSPYAKTAILIVSDGLTDLGRDTNALERSEELKADALRTARERGIPILALCLNMNGDADTSEMREIASGAELYKELTTNEYLSGELFSMLTESVGTETFNVPGLDDVPLTFRGDTLDIPFDVPGFGLESVQIMLVGRSFSELDDVSLNGPNGLSLSREQLLEGGETFLNVPVEHPGTWTLHLAGRRGDTVRLRLLYNADLSVKLDASADAPYQLRAVLEAGGATAERQEQYAGFQAALLVRDADGAEISRNVMGWDSGAFVGRYEPSAEGAYRFTVQVSAPGELTVAEDADNVRTFPIEPCRFLSNEVERVFSEHPAQDMPPRVRRDPVDVKIWRGDALEVDLAEYVTDENADTLSYTLLNQPDGVEASLSGGILSAVRFDIPVGTFAVSVTDAAGQGVELHLRVTASVRPSPLRYVIAALIVIIAAVAAYFVRRAHRPYRGTITITTEIGGAVSPRPYTQSPKKGAFPLSRFGIERLEDAFGLIPGQCVFYPSGRSSVTLYTNQAVRATLPGMPAGGVRKVTVPDGHKVSLISPDHPGNRLIIEFTSKTPKKAPRPPKPPRRPPGKRK